VQVIIYCCYYNIGDVIAMSSTKHEQKLSGPAGMAEQGGGV